MISPLREPAALHTRDSASSVHSEFATKLAVQPELQTPAEQSMDILAKRHAIARMQAARLPDDPARLRALERLVETLPVLSRESHEAHAELTNWAATFDEPASRRTAFTLLAEHVPWQPVYARTALDDLWQRSSAIESRSARSVVREAVLRRADRKLHRRFARLPAASGRAIDADAQASLYLAAAARQKTKPVPDREALGKVAVSLAKHPPRDPQAAQALRAVLVKAAPLLSQRRLAKLIAALIEHAPPLASERAKLHSDVLDLAVDIDSDAYRFGYVYKPLLTALRDEPSSVHAAARGEQPVLERLEDEIGQLSSAIDRREGRRMFAELDPQSD